MIPPSPIQLTLWGSALYTELATGLWRALAAPWLEPGWLAPARAPDRQRSDFPGAPRPAPAAGAAAGCEHSDGPGAPAGTCEGQVIEVPRGRWQRRRADPRSRPEAG
jgi:hypothetical protein